jgi:hypothetical protein
VALRWQWSRPPAGRPGRQDEVTSRGRCHGECEQIHDRRPVEMMLSQKERTRQPSVPASTTADRASSGLAISGRVVPPHEPRSLSCSTPGSPTRPVSAANRIPACSLLSAMTTATRDSWQVPTPPLKLRLSRRRAVPIHCQMTCAHRADRRPIAEQRTSIRRPRHLNHPHPLESLTRSPVRNGGLRRSVTNLRRARRNALCCWGVRAAKSRRNRSLAS